VKLALIPGHGWRKRSGVMRWDPGASDDGIQEAQVVREVARTAERLGGDRVRFFDSKRTSSGTYTERREAAQNWIDRGPGVVVHLHCNAGQGTYLMAMYDHRSTLGRTRAREWCDTADRVLRPLFDFDPDEKRVACRPDDWTSRGYSLVSPSYSTTPAGVCAVLVEVGFIDSGAHDGLWTADGIELQAQTLLAAWR